MKCLASLMLLSAWTIGHDLAAQAGQVLRGPAWSVEGNQIGGEMGTSVASAGDVNGDGFSDVIVGAYHFDHGQVDEGMTFLFLGSADGLSTSADWTAESDLPSAAFGSSVATAGDVNGDGFSDVIIGAYLFSNGEGIEGSATVFLGSATGLGATPAWVVEGGSGGANLGYSVSTAGDVNGDGFSDVIVGALNFSNGQQGEGRALVFLGSASGLATTPAWATEGNQTAAQYGGWVSTAGDVNGDGFGDVIVGAPRFRHGQTEEGRAFLFLGSSTGLATTPAWTAESDEDDAYFGYVSTAGDVNGDGFSDVIIGAPGTTTGKMNEGRAYVFLGS